MMRRLAPVFGGIALLLLGFLGIGLALPGSWEVTRTRTVAAEAEAVFEQLHDLRAWDRWTIWSEVESTLSDPSHGVGATRSWDDPTYGRGTIRLTGVKRPSEVAYRVELEGGNAWVEGRLTLESVEEGTLLVWTEAGDFGRNPLMGYVARRMPESQGAQMEEGLTRLEAAARADDGS